MVSEGPGATCAYRKRPDQHPTWQREQHVRKHRRPERFRAHRRVEDLTLYSRLESIHHRETRSVLTF